MSDGLKKAGIAVALIALLAGIAYYIWYDRELRYYQETNDARIEADQVAIASKLGGYVRAVAVGDNQLVAQGALLASIDPLDYRSKDDAAGADIAAARARPLRLPRARKASPASPRPAPRSRRCAPR